MSKDWTGYPFGGYDGSDESFEKLQDQGPKEYHSLGGERHRHEYQGQALEHQHPDGAKPHHYFGHPEDYPVVHLEGEIPVELSLAPAAEGPAWEWPAEAAPYVKRAPKWHATEEAAPVTVINDQGGETVEIPTVSCRNCQAEIHLLGGAKFGEVPDDTPWVDWGESVYCSGTELPHTPQWSRDQMQRDFEVSGFSMLMCVARRRADGKLGSLLFDHAPRFYYGWQEHTP